MARTSRKILHLTNEEKNPNFISAISKVETFNTAIYARISVETEEKRERGSMDNQVEFLKNFVTLQEDLLHVETYIDDDMTGTNFDRPAFRKLIDDIKKGRINCIVVKDLSRLGRNYVETGEFIEKIFPFLKVRFIAINDRFDSFSDHQNIVMPFKNIINEIYAKDISKKICTSVLTRQNKGEYIGGMAAYGYLKDPSDKHKLVIDLETAPIVKKIFEWKVGGLSFNAIARKLNVQGVMSPARYKHSLGILHKDVNEYYPWNSLNVKRILLNPIYMGNMVQGKSRQSLYNNQSKAEMDENKWIVIPNTHEAIIEKATFEEVKQQLADINARRNMKINIQDDDRVKNLFKGLIYCGQCGKKMVLHTSGYSLTENPNKVNASYKCRTYREHLNQVCADKRIKYNVLMRTVEKLLIEYSKVLLEDKSTLLKTSIPEQMELQSDETIRKRVAEKRIEKIRIMDVKLYTDYVEGLLTKEEYVMMKGDYQSELAFLQKEIKALEKQIQSKKKKKAELTMAKNVMKEYLKKNILTEEIIQQFIERIEIHQTDTVEIKFKFEDYVEKGEVHSISCGEGEYNE